MKHRYGPPGIFSALAMAGMLCAGCQAGPIVMTGASGASSSGASTKSSGHGSSVGGAASGAGGSTTGSNSVSGSTGGTTAGVGSGSTSGPGAPCALGRRWVGDLCEALDCASAPLGAACAFTDGGTGICAGASCESAALFEFENCGSYGIVCPTNATCVSEIACVMNQNPQSFTDCTYATCPAGTTCVEGVGCLVASCSAGDGFACALPNTSSRFSFALGACCNGSCANILGDTDNCGNCGLGCDAGQACLDGSCADLLACDGTTNNVPCRLENGDAGSCCSGTCADLIDDSANCGGCGISCPGANGCDQAGCGLGTGCPPGTVFNSSVFGCTTVSCAANAEGDPCASPDAGDDSQLCCSSACVDIETDPNNCGGCGRACAPNSVCLGGNFCVPVDDCSNPQSSLPTARGNCALPNGGLGGCCDGTCQAGGDAANCGGCGIQCPPGSSCAGYSCVDDAGALALCDAGGCPAGTACTNQGCLSTECTELSLRQLCALDAGGVASFGYCCGTTCRAQTDPESCGALCGVSCAPGTTCTFGDCDISCDAETHPCPAGTICGSLPVPGFTASCYLTACSAATEGQVCGFGPGPPIPAGTEVDGYQTLCCGNQCVDLLEDPDNCGACGRECRAGLCQGGQCFDSTPGTTCLQSCAPETVCAAGQCVDSLCLRDRTNCRARDGQVGFCCPGEACADLTNDAANCGQCGVQCPAGQTCSAGACSGSPSCGPGHLGQWCNQDAGPSYICCAGLGCIDTSNDPDNCGNCGSVCTNGSSCHQGICGF